MPESGFGPPIGHGAALPDGSAPDALVVSADPFAVDALPLGVAGATLGCGAAVTTS